MSDLLALITIIAWPIIPLFWIPLHLSPHFFKKIKLFTYLMPLCTWLPIAYLIYQYQTTLLQAKVEFPLILNLIGLTLLIIGTLLHIWTGKLLSLWGLIGLPEVYEVMEGRLVRTGAFTVVRHPTYLSHTLMFSGIFLISGVITVSLITLLDFIVIHLFIIPLEEKELTLRFGEDYRKYKNEVPRFFPRLKRRKTE
jgi:protein-S-isoprenylcysteine O-methyltransferase Ste14